jgi:hypothetical protein
MNELTPFQLIHEVAPCLGFVLKQAKTTDPRKIIIIDSDFKEPIDSYLSALAKKYDFIYQKPSEQVINPMADISYMSMATTPVNRQPTLESNDDVAVYEVSNDFWC